MIRVQVVHEPRVGEKETWYLAFDALPRPGDVLEQDSTLLPGRRFIVMTVRHSMSFGVAKVCVHETDANY